MLLWWENHKLFVIDERIQYNKFNKVYNHHHESHFSVRVCDRVEARQYGLILNTFLLYKLSGQLISAAVFRRKCAEHDFWGTKIRDNVVLCGLRDSRNDFVVVLWRNMCMYSIYCIIIIFRQRTYDRPSIIPLRIIYTRQSCTQSSGTLLMDTLFTA